MLTLTICGTLVGAVLGLRFQVLILIPAAFLALFAVAVAGIAGGEGFGATVLTMVLTATGLQLGYLCGTAAISIIAAARASGPQPARAISGPAH